MQNLNVKKNSIADIKTDLKLCFPGARTAGSAAAQGEKARGSSRGCCRAAHPSRWRSWGPPEASDRGPVAGLRVTFGSSLGPRWVPRYLPPSFSSTVDPSLRNAKRRVSQAPRMRAALGGSSLTPAGHPSRFPHRFLPRLPASEAPQSIRLPSGEQRRALPAPPHSSHSEPLVEGQATQGVGRRGAGRGPGRPPSRSRGEGLASAGQGRAASPPGAE